MSRCLVLFLTVLVGIASASDATTTYRNLTIGKAVVSLPAHWTTLGPEIPAWLHLHGAPAVVETNFAAIGAPGVLINVTLPGLSKIYADHFASPTALADLLRDTEAALRAESAAQPWRLGRLTVSSFSAGFGGVRQLLRQPEAFERIGALVMADSIYCGYAGDPAAKQVDEELMAGFVNFARLAGEGRKRFLISHSRQVPEGYASTTETADHLIGKLGGARTFATEEWPGGLRLLSTFSQGRFDVLGFDGAGPEDHMRHLRSVGLLLERAVARAETAPPAKSVAELRAQITAHVTQARFGPALWGVKVASLDTGRTLFEHHADRLLSPASNSKLYTGALALDVLGADYRIVTPILATAKPDAAGVLRGDVIVSGRGDPSWKSAQRREDFWEIFAPIVTALKSAGVRRVTGDIVADATFLRGPPSGAGWTADDLNDDYGAEISAITLEDNFADVRVLPGATFGARCELTLLHPQTGLVLENRTTTIAKGGTRRIEARRNVGDAITYVFGELPIGGKEEILDVTVPRPAQWFAAALKVALIRGGILVEGAPRSVRWPEATAVNANAVKLGEVSSPPLRELVAGFMKPSQNLETDLIFGHVGEALLVGDVFKHRYESQPAMRTSEQAGVVALRDFLRTSKLPADDVRFEEGSGLSRNNLTTARATVALLQFMATHREAQAFFDSLPIAGVDGTLRRRLKGTLAEGNVRAKTGSLRYSRALSGYMTSAAGERLVFSIMLNRQPPQPAGRSVAEEVDGIVLMLARFTGRSTND